MRHWKKMSRQLFFELRDKEYAENQKALLATPQENVYLIAPEPGEIVCDACNISVTNDPVDVFMVDGQMRRAHCPACAHGEW